MGTILTIGLKQKKWFWLKFNNLIVSEGIAVSATCAVAANRFLKEAVEIFYCKELDFLPALEDEKAQKFVGLVYYREVITKIQKEFLRRCGD